MGSLDSRGSWNSLLEDQVDWWILVELANTDTYYPPNGTLTWELTVWPIATLQLELDYMQSVLLPNTTGPSWQPAVLSPHSATVDPFLSLVSADSTMFTLWGNTNRFPPYLGNTTISDFDTFYTAYWIGTNTPAVANSTQAPNPIVPWYFLIAANEPTNNTIVKLGLAAGTGNPEV